MTAPRDPDRLIRAFLGEGLTELPDRAFDAVRLEIHGVRQRAVIGPWREPQMSNLVRVALAAAAVVVTAVVGANLLRSTGVPGPGATPSPQPSPSAAPSPSPLAYTWPRVLPAGTYSTSLIWPADLVFSFTVPDGWSSRDIEVIKGARMALQFYLVDNVVTDPCSETLAEPPLGPSPDDLAAALATLVTIENGPRNIEVGGRGSTYLEFSVGPDLGCAPGSYRLLHMPVGTCGEGCGGLGGQWKGLEFAGTEEHNRMWILSVGRGRAVINAVWTPDATAADLAELETVIESVRLDTPNATPPPEPASLEP